jgi:cytidylate kinase
VSEDRHFSDPPESPRHGFQGDRGAEVRAPAFPRGWTIAVSRESGARGGTIARRAARKLGWQAYDQEMLEYMAQEMGVGRSPLDGQERNPPPGLEEWVESELARLLQQEQMSQHPSVMDLARVVLTLGAMGQVILIGRGAGFLLPRQSTLQVRIIAPHPDRVHYLSQWQRLTTEEAAERVQQLDQRRGEYISTHFHRSADLPHQYDMLLNSSTLGEEICAELIAQAMRVRLTHTQEM